MKEKKSRKYTFVLNSPLKTFILLSIRKEGTEIKDITADPLAYIPNEIIPHSWRDRQLCVRIFNLFNYKKYTRDIYARGVEVMQDQYTNLISVGNDIYETGPHLVLDLNGKLVTSCLHIGDKVYIAGKERQYLLLKKWNIVKQAYIYTIYSIRYKTKWTMILPNSNTPSIIIYDEPIEKTCGEVEIGKYCPRKDSTIVEPIIIYNRNV